MFKAAIEGAVFGLTLSFMIGPAFFSLIQTSINRGLKAGIQLALGVALSDLIIVILYYFGMIHIIDNPIFQLLFGLVGGVILIIYGIFTSFKKQIVNKTKGLEVQKTKFNPITYIAKGFSLNFANPFVWLFWITIVAAVSSNVNTKEAIIFFFISTLGVIFSMDILKCFISHKIKHFLTPKIMFFINRIVGILLFGFGIVLIVRVIIEYLL